MKKLEKEVGKAVRAYMISDDFCWDDDDSWFFDDVSDQNESVEAAIISDLGAMGIETDEESAEFDEELFNDKYETLCAEADRIANDLLQQKQKEYRKALTALRKKLTKADKR